VLQALEKLDLAGRREGELLVVLDHDALESDVL
jgi:hypothetical protein